MTTYGHSLIAIVAAADRDELEGLGTAMGHSGREFSSPLSADGSEPASHYALHSWITTEAAAVWRGETSPTLDPDSEYTTGTIQALMTKLSISVLDPGATAGAKQHFDSVIVSLGLQVASDDTF